MSLYLAVEIDDKTKQLLAQKQLILKQNCVKGEWEDPTRFHITVRFLANDDRMHEKAMEALKLWGDTYQPKQFQAFAKDFHKFEQGVMWIGVDQSFPLYEAKYQIEDCFMKVGNQLSKGDFPSYIPHITMGYDVQESPTLNWNFEPIPFVINNISLWNGFKVNSKYIHNFLYRVDLK